MNGRNFGVDLVLKGIEAAERVGLTPIKITPFVQRGMNDHTLVDMARHFKERGHILRFIEYMDVGTLNGWRMDDVVSASQIVSMIDAELPLEPIEANYHGEVARRYRYKDGTGEIGVIASVTQPFCGDCTTTPPLTGGQHSHLPLRQRRHRPARPPTRRSVRRRPRGDHHPPLAHPRRPLLRRTRLHDRRAPHPRKGGDVSYRGVGGVVLVMTAVEKCHAASMSVSAKSRPLNKRGSRVASANA